MKRSDTDKRGCDVTVICLSDSPDVAAAPALVFSEVDEVPNRLGAQNERQAKVAELRIFGGPTVEETAEFLQISAATVYRDWASDELWLARELHNKSA